MSAIQEPGPYLPTLEALALESRLSPPPPPAAAVSRAGLVNRLRASTEPIVLVVAPAGYGKTTLLSQWAERDIRPIAWISIDNEDNDPALLFRSIEAALDRALEGDATFTTTSSSGESTPSSLAVTMLDSRVSWWEEPAVVVLDDVDRLQNRTSLRLVRALADRLPPGSALALASRTQPRLPIARLRAEGRLLELGAEELAMSSHEARPLLRRAGVHLSEEQIADLTRRTEGWPVGLFLAALSLEQAGSAADERLAEFGGNDSFVVDYMRLEVLSTFTEAQIAALTRVSVLEKLCRPLCAAVLDRPASAAELDELEQLGQFCVRLDHRHEWYRFHRLFRDVLRAELRRREPDIAPTLTSRAADWCEANGMPEDAIEYACAAGETDRAARLLSNRWFSVFDSGRMTTLAGWLDRLDRDGVLERFPRLAVAAAWIRALGGRRAEARCWLEVAAHSPGHGQRSSGAQATEPLVALTRAAMCEGGVGAMQADAELAVRSLPPRSPCQPMALLLLAISHLLAGNEEEADTSLAEVAERSALIGGAIAASLALAERALLASARADHPEAEALAYRARDAAREAGADEYATTSLVHTALAHVAVRQGDLAGANEKIARSSELLSRLGDSLPWLSVQIRLELARIRLAIADAAGAEAALAEADATLRRNPSLGALAEGARELRGRIAMAHTDRSQRTSSLTSAELRLLPLLTTHLSFREIADLLFVSRNTVKTQAISVYRKLGVSSRSEAVARAADLGLVDPAAAPA
jgi:LuxR family maltose regulon positive regulatory protein